LCVGDDGRVDLAFALQQAENSNFSGSAAAPFSLTMATEVAFVCFDFAIHLIAGNFAGNQLTQAHKECNRSVGLNAQQAGSGVRRGSGYKVLDQTPLLPRCRTAFLLIHHPLKVPLAGTLSYFSPIDYLSTHKLQGLADQLCDHRATQ